MVMLPPTGMEMWTTMGSYLASFMFISAVIRQYCPYELRRYVDKYTRRALSFLYPFITISIHEFSRERLKRSEAYASVEAYLGANTSKTAHRLKADLAKDSTNLVFTMEEHERVHDVYNGVKLWWVSGATTFPSASSSSQSPSAEKRYYSLTFHKKHRDMVTESYLKHVIKEGREIRSRSRQRKLFTNSPGYKWLSFKETMWSHIVFEHPATFDTMALDPAMKREIVEDLLTFSRSKDFYARIGKAWKRGYLLFGPPGTGKSTMIAAMANFLNYDVYDLELTAVKNNTDLRKLLIETTSKSIIVIEDIDCSLDLTGQRNKKDGSGDKCADEEPSSDKGAREAPRRDMFDEVGASRVTLSGLLNFIDGLWSSCGGERIIVFTTNYVDKLDPALIRSGRMDKHIELSYCCFEGFKVLAKNYLNLETHPMFDAVRGLLSQVKITPADVAENLMTRSPSDNPEKCLSRLIRALKEAKETAAAVAEAVKDSKWGAKVDVAPPVKPSESHNTPISLPGT